jgi:protein O-GlcNAc transferase
MQGDTIRFMMRDVMLAHDRTRFEIFGYSPNTLPPDIESSFDIVRNTATGDSGAISDDQFVALVRRDEIDVLVELTGFSMGNRFVAMSRRCAPAQVSFLNHTGSSHVPNVDYIFSDEIGTPAGDDALYSERIERLPRCFFCFDYRNSESPPISEPPVLTRGYPTFGCFGYGGKLNKQLLALWARLLRRVPDAKLHLQNPQFANYNCRQFIVSQFHNLGIEAHRLILARGAIRKDLLEIYNHIDISLDTWPYCGGNTIAESLWMGVPVVTLKGDRFSSRYGASLLAAAGCRDLVAHTPEEYIEIVAQLAGDRPRLRFLRQNLRRMSLDHGLGDSQRFARDLEHAYVEMLRRVGARQHPGKYFERGRSTVNEASSSAPVTDAA